MKRKVKGKIGQVKSGCFEFYCAWISILPLVTGWWYGSNGGESWYDRSIGRRYIPSLATKTSCPRDQPTMARLHRSQRTYHDSSPERTVLIPWTHHLSHRTWSSRTIITEMTRGHKWKANGGGVLDWTRPYGQVKFTEHYLHAALPLPLSLAILILDGNWVPPKPRTLDMANDLKDQTCWQNGLILPLGHVFLMIEP